MDYKSKLGGFAVPLDSYDVFGYFVPGLTFLMSILSFEFYVNYILENPQILKPITFHKPLYTLLKITYLESFISSWVLGLFYTIILVNIIYIVGHIISTASSILIDRLWVSRGYGYPYEKLLGIKSKKNDFMSILCKGCLFWVNFIILIAYLGKAYWDSYLLAMSAFIIALLLLILIIICKQINKIPRFKVTEDFLKGLKQDGFPSLLLNKLEDLKEQEYKTEKECLKAIENSIGPQNMSIHESLIQKHAPKINSKKCSGFVMKETFSFFYNRIDDLLRFWLTPNRSFNDDFRNKYKNYFRKNFDLDPKKSETNNYWLSQFFVLDKSNTFKPMAKNWLHLYSYARNVSMAFLYTFISLLFQNDDLSLINVMKDEINILKALPLLFICLAILMLIRYYYLYVAYYSKFIFRAFVYLNEMERKENTNEIKDMLLDELFADNLKKK